MRSSLLDITRVILFAFASIETTHAQVTLGTAASYAVLAGQAINNVGTTQIVLGNIGTYPGITITGFGPGVVLAGTIEPGTVPAGTAEKYCLAAFNKAWATPPTTALSTNNLGGLVLPPGVYSFPTANVLLTTVLTLNGASNPSGQWVFLIKGTFTTSVSSSINLVGGAQLCNVYFAVGTAATLQDATKFLGNVLAYEKIIVGKATTNNGTLCAIKGPTTLLYNKLQTYTGRCATKV